MGVLVGALLLYAIGLIQGQLHPWQYQFAVIGSVTSIWGILLWFILPDNPVKSYFLSDRLKIVAVERLRFEQVGIENKTIKWDQVRETFLDIKTYLYMLMVFAVNLTNGATTGFGSIIVQSFGVSQPLQPSFPYGISNILPKYSTLKTILLLRGAGATVIVCLLVCGMQLRSTSATAAPSLA